MASSSELLNLYCHHSDLHAPNSHKPTESWVGAAYSAYLPKLRSVNRGAAQLTTSCPKTKLSLEILCNV
eukprot:2678658-Amphidinium_carterae.1